MSDLLSYSKNKVRSVEMKTISLKKYSPAAKESFLFFTFDENIMEIEKLKIFQYKKTWKRTSALSGNQNKARQ